MSSSNGVLTSKFRNPWQGQPGSSPCICFKKGQFEFNDMDLYSTKSQVYEMLCCAGKCGSGSSSSSSSPDVVSPAYLTFGDYSVFASEMKRSYREEAERLSPNAAPASKIAHKCDKKLPTASEFIANCNNRNSTINCEVFLGGSCNPTTWRHEIAIPTLKTLGLTYFNPQVADWHPELMELEHQAKVNADVLFFTIDSQTRSLVVMLEVAYEVAKQRKVILVITGFKGPGHHICNEPITQREYEDLTCGQLILQDLVERHGIPVFNDIQTALRCTAKVIRENIRPKDLKLSDLAQPVTMGHLQNSNLKHWICSNLQKTFDRLDVSSSGEISLSDVRLAYRILTNQELTKDEVLTVLEGIKKGDKEKELITPPSVTEPSLKKETTTTNGFNGTMINFEQFFCIMSELMYHHYRNSNRSWSSLLATKASYFVQHVALPALTRILDNVPGSKQGWLPLSSKPESEPVINSHLCDVYLGGPSSSDHNWRTDVAIPFLKNHGITYSYSEPTLASRPFLPIDVTIIDKCRVLLFYISNSTRSVENMIAAVFYCGLGYQVVFCVEYLTDECQIDGEKLSQIAIKDYNRGRSYLSDMAKRKGVPVFDQINDALQCVADKCKSSSSC